MKVGCLKSAHNTSYADYRALVMLIFPANAPIDVLIKPIFTFFTHDPDQSRIICANYLHFVLTIIFVGMKNAVVDKDISAPDRDATTIKGWHTLK